MMTDQWEQQKTIDPDSRYGLVLAGGGAKGVYQIGAWRALRELGIRFDTVVGTSVGAMNGALVALDQYEGAMELWRSMSIERGFQLPMPLRKPDKLFSIKNADILVRELWKKHGLDISPLRRCLEELIDEEALRASRIDFGLVTYEVTGRRGRELYKQEIPRGRLMDYIMASAAYPGLIRPQIDGKTYLDGGLVDNVPVRMMLCRRRSHIVVVNIGDEGLPGDLEPLPDLVYIKPLDKLGTAFEFQPETAQTKMELGWFDTMKAFGRYAGDWMYFDNGEYQRMTAALGADTVSGLEYYARLIGLDKLRVFPAEEFARELLDCDRVSAEKFRLFRAHTDLSTMVKGLVQGKLSEYNLTGDILLQLAQSLLEDEKKKPRLRAMAQKMVPELMRAAEAMRSLRKLAANAEAESAG